MVRLDLNQRIEEIALTLSETFDSPKAPSVRTYEAGEHFFIQLSWVTSSAGDTILDSRCVANLKFALLQIDRHAGMETAQRAAFRSRLQALVRSRVEADQALTTADECSVDVEVPNDLF
jgi:hypothetical protein